MVADAASADGELDVGETWHYTAYHTLTQAEIDSYGGSDGDIDNTATADSNETGPDSDSAEILVFMQPHLVFQELSNLVLYLNAPTPTDPCNVTKVKFEVDDFTALKGLINDGLYISDNDIKAFVNAYSELKGTDFDLIAFSYKQGINWESNKAVSDALGGKEGNHNGGEGQLVNLSNGIQGSQFADGVLTAKEGKEQNSDVTTLASITDPCLTENNYAILGAHNFVDGGSAIAMF